MDWEYYKRRATESEAEWKFGRVTDEGAARYILEIMSDLLAEAVDTATIEELPDLVLAVGPLSTLIGKKARNQMDWEFYKIRLNDYESKWKAGMLPDVSVARDVLALMANLLVEAADNEELAMDELADLTMAVIPLASLIGKKGG